MADAHEREVMVSQWKYRDPFQNTFMLKFILVLLSSHVRLAAFKQSE